MVSAPGRQVTELHPDSTVRLKSCPWMYSMSWRSVMILCLRVLDVMTPVMASMSLALPGLSSIP
jgi:hypothetical protein